MNKYKIVFYDTTSAEVNIEASSIDEAKDIAESFNMEDLVFSPDAGFYEIFNVDTFLNNETTN